jgi:hypothetical protein
MLLMELPTFNISPQGVAGIIVNTGSRSVGSGFIAMK